VEILLNLIREWCVKVLFMGDEKEGDGGTSSGGE